jgi:nucleoside 2-deoxyribosyltransferase
MKKGDKFYLAHSVELIAAVRKWEFHVQGNYYIDMINPFRSNTFENIAELQKLKSRKKILKYMQTLDLETCQKIVTHDLGILRKCDGIVAVFNQPSVGTAQEIFAAYYLYQLPVYVIAGEYSKHPWIYWICVSSGGNAFKTKKDFEAYVESKGLKKEV